MYSALIIDDEPDARGVLSKMLELFCPQVGVTYQAPDGPTALTLAKRHQPDITFLDIRLRKENGLDIAGQLKPFCENIIFVTAYDEYAVEAFRTSAVHYLLKHINPEHLQEAVERAIQRLQQQSAPTILLSTKNSLIKLEQSRIEFVRGEGNYSTFYCNDGSTHLVSKNLAHYSSLLDSASFVRVHQSFLVRIAAVEQFIVREGYFVVMKSGQKLPVSRRRKDDLLQALQG